MDWVGDEVGSTEEEMGRDGPAQPVLRHSAGSAVCITRQLPRAAGVDPREDTMEWTLRGWSELDGV